MVVSVSDTVVDEDTMVVHLGDTMLADTTMFRPRWFQDVTCSTRLTWVEEGVVVRI